MARGAKKIGVASRKGTDIHSNSVEGVFSLLKRGVYGTFHSVSKKHLPNYLNEFEFRFNTRKQDDGERSGAPSQDNRTHESVSHLGNLRS